MITNIVAKSFLNYHTIHTAIFSLPAWHATSLISPHIPCRDRQYARYCMFPRPLWELREDLEGVRWVRAIGVLRN